MMELGHLTPEQKEQVRLLGSAAMAMSSMMHNVEPIARHAVGTYMLEYLPPEFWQDKPGAGQYTRIIHNLGQFMLDIDNQEQYRHSVSAA